MAIVDGGEVAVGGARLDVKVGADPGTCTTELYIVVGGGEAVVVVVTVVTVAIMAEVVVVMERWYGG